ncbi:MAG: glycerol-3-phosphate acyltransferase [Dehalococcoidia bacterium]|nr:glycerol-3-phosphate acyltransferase [Dehalococcoidia bacterium]
MLVADIALIVGAYLLGSLPHMILLGRALGIDLSHEEDLHMALWYKAGRLWGLSVVIVDVLKGVIPIVIGFSFHLHLAAITASGVAAVMGQMWPVFRKFDGEKGNTTGIGVVITLTSYLTATISPLAYLVFIIFAIPILIGGGIKTVPKFMAPGQTLSQRLMLGGPTSNSMPLGMLIGFAAAPLASACLRQPPEMTWALLAIFVVIMIRRLTAGLGKDLKTATISVGAILLNRFLYDRSYF